jgi:uncharacterized protein
LIDRLKNRWTSYRSEVNTDFYTYIADLLEDKTVMDLDKYIHHYCFTRLKHSLDVAYISYVIARILRWDAGSVARAGLLHDLFFYDWREEDMGDSSHVREHPKVALENARKITHVNEVEADIILSHMWLATAKPPRFKEGFIVTFVDKYCASSELLKSVFTRSRLRAVYENA